VLLWKNNFNYIMQFHKIKFSEAGLTSGFLSVEPKWKIYAFCAILILMAAKKTVTTHEVCKVRRRFVFVFNAEMEHPVKVICFCYYVLIPKEWFMSAKWKSIKTIASVFKNENIRWTFLRDEILKMFQNEIGSITKLLCYLFNIVMEN
jgi:hypothetical protein